MMTFTKHYIVTIPGPATNYCDLTDIIKKIYKQDAKVSTDSDFYPGEWAIICNGSPDKRLTLLQLQLPAKVVKKEVLKFKECYDLYSERQLYKM